MAVPMTRFYGDGWSPKLIKLYESLEPYKGIGNHPKIPRLPEMKRCERGCVAGGYEHNCPKWLTPAQRIYGE